MKRSGASNAAPRTRVGRTLAGALVALVTLSACAQGPVARGKIAGIDSIVKKAEANGAMRCAPRELALAKSHPGMNGFGRAMFTRPERMYVSIGLTDAASTRTRTSPGFGSGVGRSPDRITSGVPVWSR